MPLCTPVTLLDGPRNVVPVAHFASSARRVVGASWDGTARVWDATPPYLRWHSPPISDDRGLVIRRLRTIPHGAAVNAVAFASTGRDLVSGAVDGAKLVTHDHGALLALPASCGGIDVTGFLPDGRGLRPMPNDDCGLRSRP